MLSTGKTWKEVAKVLGVSTPAMSQWKTGKTKPSKKILFRLEQAERDAGILPPQPAPPPAGYGAENASSKNIKISEMGGGKGIDPEELRRTIDELKRLTADLERIYKRK